MNGQLTEQPWNPKRIKRHWSACGLQQQQIQSNSTIRISIHQNGYTHPSYKAAWKQDSPKL